MSRRAGNKNIFLGIKSLTIKCFFIKPVLAIFLFFLSPFSSFAFQAEDCDEVPVTIGVKHLGQIELPSLLCNNEVFFSVTGIFDFLHIRNIPSNDFSRVEGFIKNQNDTFLIDEQEKEITYQGTTFPLQERELIKKVTGLYLKSDLFEEIFGFNNEFNARLLAAAIIIDFELPSIKAARQKQMRENIQNIQGNFIADTTITRDRPLLNVGALNWNLSSSQRTDGLYYNRFNIGFGGLLAGGEFTGNINYNSNQEFQVRNQFYQWRYVNNESDFLRQITAGKIGSNSIASVFNPVVGVKLTNAPTYLRKSFSTYQFSDYTEPNWIVELYINNVLTDYVTADASGFFTFNVPLMYGSTSVQLRYYGPWGEEEVVEKEINIPFNFLPSGEMEYSLSSGFVEDGSHSIFTQARLDYGLSSRVTLGAGIEFLSSLEKDPLIPFLETSIRLPYNMMLSGQYLNEVGYKGNFTFISPSNLRLDLKYVQYEKEQQAVRFNYLEERLATISFPVNFGSFTGNSRLIFRQNILRSNTFTNLEWLLSGRILGIRMNLLNTAFFHEYTSPLVFSRLSTSIMLPKNIIFSPQLEYDHTLGRMNAIRGELRSQIFKNVYIQSSYDRNFRYDQFNLNLGVNIEFGFSRLALNSNISNKFTSLSQSIGGSLFYDQAENYLRLDNRAIIGRGSLKFSPFLDLNANGKRDPMEPDVRGLEIQSSNGGMKEKLASGNTIITALEPYIPHYFQFDQRGFDRIAWSLDKKSMNIYVNPNQMKVIDIPVMVLGEVAGFVYDSNGGLGGIQINIFNEKEELVESILSESDGYFSFLGLKSGNYSAQPDSSQLDRLDMTEIDPISFNINNGQDGDFVDDLEFVVQTK
ncbi:MAG TPA: hypothetical protein VLO29_10595 [Salegentibacter sp.]|nr:hypothetical protein [Salegentibacter sp.]